MYTFLVILGLPQGPQAYYQCASNPSAAYRLVVAKFLLSSGQFHQVRWFVVKLHNW